MTKQALIRRLKDERPTPPRGFEARQKALLNGLINQEDVKMKRKMSLGLVFVLVLVLLSASAMAATLVFSPKYEATRIANQALKAEYGITEDMLSVFHRQTVKNDDGSTIITYTPFEPTAASRIGVYTVTVRNVQADVQWSNAGKDTSGGILAEAWGAEQLALYLSDYDGVLSQLQEATGAGIRVASTPRPKMNAEEEAEFIAALEKTAQNQEEEYQKMREDALARSTYSMEELIALGKDAIRNEYGLTSAQCDKLKHDEGQSYSEFFSANEEGQLTVDLMFWLWQNDEGARSGKDGQYWVTVNLETGVIEDMLYDSGLLGNG